MLDRVPAHLKILAFLGFVFAGPAALVAYLLGGVWGVVGLILVIVLLYTVLYFVAVKQYL